MKELDEIKRQTILNDLKNNKCILLLGPSIKSIRYKKDKFSVSDIFTRHLIPKLESERVDFLRDRDNYYYYVQKYMYKKGRDSINSELDEITRSYFNNISSIYGLLAKLPFNTIVNFGFDWLMSDTLRKEGYEFYQNYYNYNGEEQKYLKDLDDKIQFVYNLLGSSYDPTSQIWTEADQLEFMRKIVSGPKLPDNVISRFKVTSQYKKSFIFLGFNFDDWPFRFLLDVLGIPYNENSITAKNGNANIAVFTEEFYADKFGLDFLSDTNEAFVKKLIIEYKRSFGLSSSKKKAFISYHDKDSQIVDEFKNQLTISGLSRRVNFWDKEDIVAGDLTEEETSKQVSETDVYIPFISADFLNDNFLLKQLKSIISNNRVIVFPIITRICNYDYLVPELRKRARLILPDEEKSLKSGGKIPADEDYILLIKKINGAIR